MKKIFALILSILMLLLCGCGPNENQFVAHYLPSVSYDPNFPYPSITVLHNMDELDAFAESVEREEVLETLSTYNDMFFKKRILFVLVLDKYIGYQDNIVKVCQEDGITTFVLKRIHNHNGVGSLGSMTILVEMDKSWDCEVENIRIEYQ